MASGHMTLALPSRRPAISVGQGNPAKGCCAPQGGGEGQEEEGKKGQNLPTLRQLPFHTATPPLAPSHMHTCLPLPTLQHPSHAPCPDFPPLQHFPRTLPMTISLRITPKLHTSEAAVAGPSTAASGEVYDSFSRSSSQSRRGGETDMRQRGR